MIIGIIQTFWNPGKKRNPIVKGVQEQLEEEEHEFHRIGIKKRIVLGKSTAMEFDCPCLFTLGIIIIFLWQDGTSKGAKTIFDAFSIADATFVMLLAVFITLVLSFIFYIIRRQN